MTEQVRRPATTGARHDWPAVAAVVVLALNLRPAVNAIGALLPEIRLAVGLSATVAGVLASLPPLCFAVFGLLAPALGARIGTERALVAGLALMSVGQVARVLDGTPALFAGSLATLAGLAICNVLMPSVIRTYFPTRIPLLTSVYTTCLVIGAATSSAASVPIERAVGADWRLGAGMWATMTVIALVPWLALIRRNSRSTPTAQGGRQREELPVRALLRSKVAWTIGIYFGLQTIQAYVITSWLAQITVDGGADQQTGGYSVGVFSVLGAVVAVTVPFLLRTERRLRTASIGLAGLYLLGYLGLILYPAAAVWSSAVLLGLASGSFPLILALLALRARTPAGVAALSAFAQSAGYLIGAAGPVLIGALHDLTGGWTVPLVVMMVSAALMAVVGSRAADPTLVEDDLSAPTR